MVWAPVRDRGDHLFVRPGPRRVENDDVRGAGISCPPPDVARDHVDPGVSVGISNGELVALRSPSTRSTDAGSWSPAAPARTAPHPRTDPRSASRFREVPTHGPAPLVPRASTCDCQNPSAVRNSRPSTTWTCSRVPRCDTCRGVDDDRAPRLTHTHPHGGSGGPGLFQQVRKFHPGIGLQAVGHRHHLVRTPGMETGATSSSTCSDSRVRQPAVRRSVCTATGRRTSPMRSRVSARTCVFNSNWASGWACNQLQPPHRPGPNQGQGLGTRTAAGSPVTARASARQKRLSAPPSTTSARTVSPGSP